MKYKFISDTHFEFYVSDRKVLDFIDTKLCDEKSHETVLLHGGDLHRVSKLTWVLGELAQRFAHVVYVPGNHEAYGSSVETVGAILDDLEVSNLHVLNPGVVHFNDVTIIGATLWTNLLAQSDEFVNAVTHGISDFSRIEKMTAQRFTAIHRRDAAFIKRQLELTEGQKTIVMTHHLPSHQCIHPRYRAMPYSILNSGFAADLDEVITTFQPEYWLFGHTHDSMELGIGSTRLIANPYGYQGYEENPQFDPGSTFEL